MQDVRPAEIDLDGLDAHPAAAPAAERREHPLRANVLYCLKVFVGVRIGLGILALLATALLVPNVATSVPGWPAPVQTPGWHNIFTAWERWDALWFLRIATGGYASGDLTAAFFPLYPLLIRGLTVVMGGHPFAAAMIVSNLASLGACIVVYELTRAEWDETFARRTVLYMSIFPTAYFFVAPYSESLFLLLTASALLAARRGRWDYAAACGALAAATRSIGLVLILPLALEAISQARSREKGRFRAALLPLAASAFVTTGTLAYLFFWKRFNGDFLTPLNDQNGWLREFSLPWSSVVKGTTEAFRFIGTYSGGYHQVDWLIVMFALAALVWVLMRTPLTYASYALASLVVPLSFIFEGRPFMSMPRFILPIFPLFWALARLAERFRANDAVVAVSAAGLGVMTVLFVNWYFVF